MTEPDDRELEQYLAGGSKLSRRYRDASGESAPAALDEIVLAQARAAARRKPTLNQLLTPLAAVATVVVAVNIGVQVYRAEPVPAEMQAQREASGAKARALAGAPPRAAPAPPPAPTAVEDAAAELEAIEVTGSRIEQPEAPAEAARARAEDDAGQKREAELRENFARQAQAQQRKAVDEAGYAAPVVDVAPAPAPAPASEPAPAAAPAAGLADKAAPPLTDAQKIDRLIAYVGKLEGAVFIRNGDEHSAADAAKHLAYKRRKAGDRVKTPDDFIRLCASHSSQSGDAYLIRFADGRTRTAEDVLRDELARLEGPR
jgi:hypothetical protein